MAIKLTWTASIDVVDGYNVYRGSTAGNETVKVNSSLVVGVTFTDNTPLAGPNFYIVKSSKAGLESLGSNEVSAVILPAPPTNLVAAIV